MLGVLEIAKVIGEVSLVARRQQRGHQDQVGHTVGDRGDRRVLRIGEDELRPDPILHDLPQRCRLFRIGFQRQDERH